MILLSLSAEVKNTAQLHTRDRVTLMFVYAFWSLLKTLLWLWNAINALFIYLNFWVSVMLDSLSCSFISIFFLTISLDNRNIHFFAISVVCIYYCDFYFIEKLIRKYSVRLKIFIYMFAYTILKRRPGRLNELESWITY